GPWQTASYRTGERPLMEPRSARPFHGAGGQTKAGFTVVGLLVVIAIIAILFAITLPAIQRRRTTVLHVQCQSNMKQIGLALHNYHETYDHFPAPRGTHLGNQYILTEFRGWMCEILPYIEQDELAQAMYTNPWYNGFFATYSTPVKIYLCPSDPRDL